MEWTPSVLENYTFDVIVDGNQVTLNLCDNTGLSDYDKLRRLIFPQTDVFLLCFSLANPSSFESVRNRWIKEAKDNCPGVPVILVGTMLDLRDDEENIKQLKKRNLSPIAYDQGLAMAEEIGAVKYLECSALTGNGLQAVFEEVSRVVLYPKPTNKLKEKCSLS